MALIEHHQKTTEISYWEGQIPMSYIYTTGRAGQRFFQGLIQGKITGTECRTCRSVYVPPRIFCEKCFERLEEAYVEVSPRGTVHTFTICYEKYDGTAQAEPSLLAFIQLEGTQSGLVHFLGEVKPEAVGIGMAVEAVFKDPTDRKGHILDIRYFRPLQ